MIETNEKIPAVLVGAFKDTSVTIERDGDMIAVFDRDGTRTHRLPVVHAGFMPAAHGSFFLVFRGTRFRLESQYDAAVRAMLPEADRKTHGPAFQPVWRASQPAGTGTPADKRRFALGFLNAAKFATLVYAILGVIGGIIVAATTVDYDSGFYDYSERPYVGWGIAAIVATLATAVVVGAVLVALSFLIERADEPGRV